jgi:hypothetical protein
MTAIVGLAGCSLDWEKKTAADAGHVRGGDGGPHAVGDAGDIKDDGDVKDCNSLLGGDGLANMYI